MEKILNKIEKLLALATSSNPNEAAVALAKAQELMAEHNLTDGALERNKIGEAMIKSTQSVSKMKDWELALVSMIGGAFGCRVMWQPARSWQEDNWAYFILVGPKTQLQLAEYAATFLLRKVVDGRRQFVASLQGYGYGRFEKTKMADGFCHGFLKAVRPKVHALANPEAVEQAIQAWIDERASGDLTKAQRRDGDLRGYLAGRDAGLETDLHRPMNGPADQLQLGGR